jgi:hypothetical protein
MLKLHGTRIYSELQHVSASHVAVFQDVKYKD